MNAQTKISKKKPERKILTFEEFQTSIKKKDKRKGDSHDLNNSNSSWDKNKSKWQPTQNSDEEFLKGLEEQLNSLEVEYNNIHSRPQWFHTEAKLPTHLPMISEEWEPKNINEELDEFNKWVEKASYPAETWSPKSTYSMTK